MRDKATPEQIDSVLAAVRELWLNNPHQRLGQLMLNLVYVRGCSPDTAIPKLWNMDEETILLAIDNWNNR